MLDDVGSNAWYCIKHVPTSSNMLSGHQTRWPNDIMLVHPTCWVVQHLSFGRAFTAPLNMFETFLNVLSLRGRANARNVSFSISVRWSIYIINSVDQPNFRVSLPHRRSTTVSLETNPLYSFLNVVLFTWSAVSEVTGKRSVIVPKESQKTFS